MPARLITVIQQLHSESKLSRQIQPCLNSLYPEDSSDSSSVCSCLAHSSHLHRSNRETGHHHLGLTSAPAPTAAATSLSKDLDPPEAPTSLYIQDARPATITAPSLPRPATEPASSSSAEARLGTSFQSLTSATAVFVKLSCHQSMPEPKSACRTPRSGATRRQWGRNGPHTFHTGHFAHISLNFLPHTARRRGICTQSTVCARSVPAC